MNDRGVKAESFKTRLLRWGFNHFPAYRRTGGRITYIAADVREVRIKLPLNRKTRNYVGTVFGGAMFGALDGVHMVMLIKVLGPDYAVWDKAATIRYKQPGRTMLYARVVLEESIRAELLERPKLDRLFHVDWTDATGNVYASVEKTIHVRRAQRRGPGGQRRDSRDMPEESPDEEQRAHSQQRETEGNENDAHSHTDTRYEQHGAGECCYETSDSELCGH